MCVCVCVEKESSITSAVFLSCRANTPKRKGERESSRQLSCAQVFLSLLPLPLFSHPSPFVCVCVSESVSIKRVHCIVSVRNQAVREQRTEAEDGGAESLHCEHSSFPLSPSLPLSLCKPKAIPLSLEHTHSASQCMRNENRRRMRESQDSYLCHSSSPAPFSLCVPLFPHISPQCAQNRNERR